MAALLFVVGWALSGPLFGFSEGWQLVINTGTTILTFLMIFLLQNSQNRDTESVQLKLDELIRALGGARDSMVGIEQLDDEEREKLRKRFAALAEKARGRERTGAEPTSRSPSAREENRRA